MAFYRYCDGNIIKMSKTPNTITNELRKEIKNKK